MNGATSLLIGLTNPTKCRAQLVFDNLSKLHRFLIDQVYTFVPFIYSLFRFSWSSANQINTIIFCIMHHKRKFLQITIWIIFFKDCFSLSHLLHLTFNLLNGIKMYFHTPLQTDLKINIAARASKRNIDCGWFMPPFYLCTTNPEVTLKSVTSCGPFWRGLITLIPLVEHWDKLQIIYQFRFQFVGYLHL